MVIEKWYNRMMVTLTNMLLPGPDLHYASAWQFGDFYDVFLPNIGKGQKKVLPSEHGAPGSLRYGKSGPSFCITFIKKLDKGLRQQLLGQKPLTSPGLYI